MPTIIALCQRKGGTSKTTLAVSLAAAATYDNVSARKRSKDGGEFPRGNGPILVDVDSQGNASTWCFGAPARDTIARAQSVAMLAYPVALEWCSPASPLRAVQTREELLELVLPDVLRDSVVPGLRIIGSTPTSHPEETREILLRELPGDVLIVDTGADTSTPIVRSVLAQADAVIVPAVPEPWSVDGIGEVFEEIRSVGRADLLHEGRVRIVITKRERTRVHDALEGSLRTGYGQLVSETVVPKSAAIALVSHRAENLSPRHALRKIAGEILREILEAADAGRAAA